MSRLRVMMARACTAFIYVQIFLMNCR
ncbi:conjugal transfer protein TraR, partial [Salmonella enterica subsp. enterica serovar Typhimurium]|nr:conjugal transfer protein TraR [Salmonella enterica subsp. enterica serovar Typhimurium]